MPTLYHGTLIHSLSLTQLEVLPNALLCVSDTDGIIEWLERGVEGSEIQEVAARKGVILDGGVEVVVLGKGEVLCPGMIDTHTVSGVPTTTTTSTSMSTTDQGPSTIPSPP
jgi:guanine deaminase